MNKLIISIAMVSLLVTGYALADPVEPPKHTPEWTDTTPGDPGRTNAKTATLTVSQPVEPVESVVPELAKIVVLCAKEEEEKFKAEWSKYVKHHDLKGRELQKTIHEVSESAAAQRNAERISAANPSDEEKWKAERRNFMNEVAREIFGPSPR
jgi:hypothetical protein